ncbi:hypothetical protein CcrC1_gp374 [Caulobacter phage C1]|nr:hypothetical protein CcrC1_gp374 [Caulobacter phage C1]UTU08603.1 hypothetical protein CcrC2_gp375 [Caulobacter phage C2]UTU09118.1 hypothetical protein CcrJ4_gp369 [Caulobacter phage J4]WGN97270.1 hypothetical protein [Bertelyvirus sp.]WGN97788.1 hypothetical protein [Bertelyvirus sp.]
MGWADCGTDSQDRPIGYAHAATCDHPGCEAQIHRGLAYACGGMHGSSSGCEGYFCADHLVYVWDPGEGVGVQVCETCESVLKDAMMQEFMDLMVSAVREPSVAPQFHPINEQRIDVYLQGHRAGTLQGANGRWEFVDEGFRMPAGHSAGEALAICTKHFVQPPLGRTELRQEIMRLMIRWDHEDLHHLPLNTGLLSPADEQAIVKAKQRHAAYSIKIEPNVEVIERLQAMTRERNSKVVFGEALSRP